MAQKGTGLNIPSNSGSDRYGRTNQTRRMTSPSAFTSRIPPPALPLGLPEPSSPGSTQSRRQRSRSPLGRTSTTVDDSGSEVEQFTDYETESRASFTAPRPLTDKIPGGGTSPTVSGRFASTFMRVGSSLMSSSVSNSEHHSQNSPFGTSDANGASGRKHSAPSVTSTLTDAELEAEALKEKERSRMEAERILTMEAEERRHMEEKILAMRRPTTESYRSSDPHELPASAIAPPLTPKREEGTGGWLGLMKKLTPTKDLTPAQQIINETKAKEKERDKERKREDKDREKERGHEWPSTAKAKLSDPTYLSLSTAGGGSIHSPSSSPTGMRLGPAHSPGAYTPFGSPRQTLTSQNGFAPTPVTPTSNRPRTPTHGPPGSSPILSSTSNEPPPIYAVFTPSGSLDLPGTLITVTRRFEKLEKWAVGHVRALEERMKDVEKYLIDKEEKETQDVMVRKEVDTLKGEINSLQDLLKNLSSEFAEYKMRPSPQSPAPSPLNGSGPPRVANPLPNRITPKTDPKVDIKPASLIETKPATSTYEVKRSAPPPAPAPPPPAPVGAPSRILPRPVPTQVKTPSQLSQVKPLPATVTPHRETAPPAVSPPPQPVPPTTSSVMSNSSSRSRLPYPTGDYTAGDSPSFSSTSRPTSPEVDSPGRPISALSATRPVSQIGTRPGTSFSSRPVSYHSAHSQVTSPTPPPQMDLVPPKTPVSHNRSSSASPSPTPRKRYTVALSGKQEGGVDGLPSPNNATRAHGQIQTALFSDSPNQSRPHSPSSDEDDEYPLTGGHGRDTSDVTVLPDRQKSPSPTIGRTTITLSRLSTSPPSVTPSPSGGTAPLVPRSRTRSTQSSSNSPLMNGTTPKTPSGNRARAQSTYFAPNNLPTTPTPEAGSRSSGNIGDRKPLPRPHRRAQSTDRFGALSSSSTSSSSNGGGMGLGLNVDVISSRSSIHSTISTPSSATFVDPLVLRKKERKETGGAPGAVKSPAGGNKIPFGQLIAFFDN